MAESNRTNIDANRFIEPSLHPLVAKLRRRYSGVQIVWASFTTLDDRVLQQNIRFSAPLERLLKYGLVTDAMMKGARDSRCGSQSTPIGDGYHLCDGLDGLSMPGHWDLSIFTGAVPRERSRISTREATRELRRIMRGGER